MSDISPLYLLDTNILVHYVRGSPVWQRVNAAHGLLTVTPTPRYCVVSDGEIRSLALQWRWGAKKVDQMDFCLGYFQSQTIERPRVMEMYAVIDAYCESVGQSMGKNDLWIAATVGAALITTDRDFDRIAPQFLNHIWVDTDSSA